MFELTGELDATLPHMVAILVAKWTADAIGKQSVYDLAQNVLGHPFLDHESAMGAVQKLGVRAEELIPPARTMDEITVVVPESGRVKRALLEEKRAKLEARGLLDAGLVLVRLISDSKTKYLQGYIAQGELIHGLASISAERSSDLEVRVLGEAQESDEADISAFIDRTPVSVCAQAPMEYVVEMFGKLGLRYLMVTEEGSGGLVGVVIKKASPPFFYRVWNVLTVITETGRLPGWHGRRVGSCYQCSINVHFFIEQSLSASTSKVVPASLAPIPLSGVKYSTQPHTTFRSPKHQFTTERLLRHHECPSSIHATT
jgi:hypothetical protein